MEFRMPEYTVNYEVNKQDPYPLLSEGMRRVIDYQAENAKDAFVTDCSWDELRAKYVQERRFWNEGGPEAFKTVETTVEGPIGPEAKFPIPLYESAAVTRYFHEHGEEFGILPDKMAIGGDSGGGNLALAVNLYLRDVFGGNDYIAALLLYYGSYGMMDSASYRLYGTELDGMRKADMAYYISCYLDPEAHDEENPYFVTLNNDLTHGIPATYLCCGDLDPLLDDSRALEHILRVHGVRTQFDIVPGALHAFMHYGRMMDEAVQCLKRSGEFYKSVVEG